MAYADRKIPDGTNASSILAARTQIGDVSFQGQVTIKVFDSQTWLQLYCLQS